MGQLYLVLGPVGAGKSTYAGRLALRIRGVWLNLDDWMVTLFGEDDRPEVGRMDWYMERCDRCLRQIWKTTLDLAERDIPVVLELGLVQRHARSAFYEKVDATEHELSVHVLDAPLDARWERVQQRNEQRGATFSMLVSREVFELASRVWEPPDEQERLQRAMHFVEPT